MLIQCDLKNSSFSWDQRNQTHFCQKSKRKVVELHLEVDVVVAEVDVVDQEVGDSLAEVLHVEHQEEVDSHVEYQEEEEIKFFYMDLVVFDILGCWFEM